MLAAAGDFYRDRIEDQLISGDGHVICAKSSSRIRVGIASSTQGNDKLQVRMAAVKQQVLNWLYSVLTSVDTLPYTRQSMLIVCRNTKM
jgi:hypothetical protein